MVDRDARRMSALQVAADATGTVLLDAGCDHTPLFLAEVRLTQCRSRLVSGFGAQTALTGFSASRRTR